MKHIFTFLIVLLNFSFSSAQLMDGKPQSFSRKDSLRGTLSVFRSCYDVSYYHLNISINIDEKKISGYNKIKFKSVENFNKIQVDLFENLSVDKIIYHGKNLNFKREFNAVFIEFPTEIKKGSVDEIDFYYSGQPTIAKRAPWDGGFVFSKDKNDKPWVAVACQGFGASCWWPNKDHQSDEPDSMLISIACRSDLEEISNGRLRSTKKLDNGYTQHNWFVANPINNYDVTFNIGDYAHFNDVYFGKVNKQNLTLDYYVLKENLELAKKQFEQVKGMMDAFEKRFGPYPFYEDGYKLVETPYLGMEHQSCVAYGNGYKNGYRGFDLSGSGEGKKFDYIIIHESAHEWWGNSLTSYDIADMWIHEGFGQYSEVVYLEELYGKESSEKYLNGLKKGVRNKESIIGTYGVNQEGAGDMYPKGALFLNTIRNCIDNDEVWWKIVKGLQEKYKHQNISTEDVNKYMNEVSGKNLDPLFNQYLRYASLPILEFKKTQKGKDVEINFQWNANIENFNLPILYMLKGVKQEKLFPNKQSQTIVLKNCGIDDIELNRTAFYYSLSE